MANAATFARQLLAEGDELMREQTILLHKRMMIEGLRRVVMKSPVDTGRFRGNWTVTLGSPSDATVETMDKSGGPTIAAGSAVAAGIKMPTVGYLQNNLPYGPRLESGWSNQAPSGMVALTVAELETMFARVSV